MNILKALVVGVLCFAVGNSIAEATTKVSKQPFGKMPDGTAIDIYTLSDGPVEVRIMTLGGVVVSLKTPDRKGNIADVVWGFDDVDGYAANDKGPGTAYFGALIGRYGNRIGKAQFTLEGKTYQVPKNNGENSLHGGPNGFHNVVWKGKEIPSGVALTYLSKDGEEGYPGNLSVTVHYTLVKGDLKIEYSATTDKPTVVNLTNHSYFNLTGDPSKTILDHQLTLHASRTTPVDSGLIPTGELRPVSGTPFDFTKATAIGARINADDEQLKFGKGYDHNWVLNNKGGTLTEAGELYDPGSGRVMRVLTTEPAIQFYSGNFLDGSIKGKGGVPYNLRTALCLETQHYPDSPNHSDFPSTELKPGGRYHTVTVYSFSSR